MNPVYVCGQCDHYFETKYEPEDESDKPPCPTCGKTPLIFLTTPEETAWAKVIYSEAKPKVSLPSEHPTNEPKQTIKKE